MDTTPIFCPCCLHQETIRARTNKEACYDDQALMFWCPPNLNEMRRQVFAQWDQGWWECQICELRLPPFKAGVLLDAALKHAFPNCDSIDADGIHADTKRAWAGGPIFQPT
jgi:hypothetical protein